MTFSARPTACSRSNSGMYLLLTSPLRLLLPAIGLSNPLPLTVCRIIMLGFVACPVSASALPISVTLWPSTSQTFHPKDSHRRAHEFGSSLRTLPEPLASSRATTLRRPWRAADNAASQICPSVHSPSPSTANTLELLPALRNPTAIPQA